jgi:two-component system, sensor histidine kinase and response regulator
LKELNATKDKFFSIIAHDLKNPFNSILGFSDMLKEEAHSLDIDSIVKYSATINASAQKTYRLLDNLLNWAMMQRGSIPFEPKNMLLKELIRNEIENLSYAAEQKNIILTDDVKEEITVYADQVMISTVLRNLILNAIKFTQISGKVNIGAKIKGERVEISVSDSGIGMDKETIDKLFKIETSFSSPGTENEKGSGLGLLLCSEFAEKHGGEIEVESEEGKGSTFKFSVPCGKA